MAWLFVAKAFTLPEKLAIAFFAIVLIILIVRLACLIERNWR